MVELTEGNVKLTQLNKGGIDGWKKLKFHVS